MKRVKVLIPIVLVMFYTLRILACIAIGWYSSLMSYLFEMMWYVQRI